MAIEIQIDDPFSALVRPEPIVSAAHTALRLAASASDHNSDVAITITDAETVQTLNAQYRGIDAPTDVLSFENMPDPDFPVAETELAGYLGDIIIAYPVAQAQAERAGHSPLNELQLLTVHGTLHLLGFDHDTPANKAAMWQAQSQILAALGLAHVQPTET